MTERTTTLRLRRFTLKPRGNPLSEVHEEVLVIMGFHRWKTAYRMGDTGSGDTFIRGKMEPAP